MILIRKECVLLLLVVLLFIALGFDILVYFFLYMAGLLGSYMILRDYLNFKIGLSLWFFLPVLLFLFMLITPGSLLKDMHVAGIAASAFFSGAACFFYLRDKIEYILFTFPVSLLANFVSSCLAALLFSSPLLGTSGAAGRLALSFSGPFIVAELATFCIFILLCFYRFNRSMRLFGYAMIPVLSLIILMSGSRSAFLGVITFLLFVFFTFSRKKAIISALTIFVSLMFLFPWIPRSQQLRMVGMVTSPTQEATFQTRMPLWSFAYKEMLNSPVVGNGMRNFQKEYEKFLKSNYDMLKKENQYIEARTFKHPHNMYIQILYGWGIVGLILFIATLWQGIRNSSGSLKIFLSYIYAFMFGAGFFDTRLLSKDGAIFLFFPVGMAFASCIHSSKASLNSKSVEFGSQACRIIFRHRF